MSSRRPGTIASTLSIFLIALTGHGLAMAETTAAPVQVLDTVALFGQNAAGGLAQEVVFPESGNPFLEDTAAKESGATYQACKLTSGRGLFCLDGNTVKQWSNPKKGPAVPILRCDDSVGLTACTGMTVDIAGNIWLAGKNKGKTHTLVKVSEFACGGSAIQGSSSFDGLDGKRYCASAWASDRPLLEDITAVDGDVGAQFPGGPGILGLQERTRVFYFPFGPIENKQPPQPVEIASGKNSWNLSGGERLQSVSVWQPGAGQNSVLATSSTGKIRIKDLSDTSTTTVISIPGAGTDKTAFYGIRSSSKSGLVYVTDRTGQKLQVLDPANGWSSIATIGTAPLSPTGPTVAAGVSVDLSKCTINTATGKCEAPITTGATLLNANGALAPGASGVTIFQVKDIPDCRWVDADVCNTASEAVIYGPDGKTAGQFDPTGREASRQYLNVTPLLPAEVTDLFELGALPPLLISPQYRAQAGDRPNQPNRYFDAFFAIPEDGVVFTGVFEGEYEVGRLVNEKTPDPNELGCDGTFGLEWDVLTRVSEKFRSVGDRHVDTMINTGCGSSLGSKFGFSLIPYNLEITPDNWIPDPTSAGGLRYVPANDAVFGRLMQQLFGELSEVLDVYACDQQDNLDNLSAPPPISTATCDVLKSQLANAGDKLNKCILATYQPKQSSGNQNCQAFESQFGAFRSLVDQMRATEQCPGSTPGQPVYDCDVANRKSELYVRAKVIQHVYDTRFVPSIPSGGFCVESGTCSP